MPPLTPLELQRQPIESSAVGEFLRDYARMGRTLLLFTTRHHELTNSERADLLHWMDEVAALGREWVQAAEETARGLRG